MSIVGKNSHERATQGIADNTQVQAASRPSQASQATAAYIADLCAELTIMAKQADLGLVAYFLAMAQAEARHAAERTIAAAPAGA